MKQVHLVLGPVGAGKSTYAARLSHEYGAVWLNLDAWMATLYGEENRPETGRIEWYVERTGRCLKQIWQVAEDILERDTPVVLELGLIQRAARNAFYEKVDASALSLKVHVLDAPLEVRWQRVQVRNEEKGATFSMVVPQEIFTLASRLWEPPDDEECHERDVLFVPPSGG